VNTTIQPVALLLLFTLSACSGAPAPETANRPGGDAKPQALAPAGDAFTRALDTALTRRSWQNLRIDSECQDDAGQLRAVRLYGTGVGIWNNERQFTLSQERLLGVLEALRRAGFGAMRDTHGGKDDPGTAAQEQWGLEMICRVRVALDGVEKQSYQLSEGRQSAELKDLAGQVLALGEELGPSGVAAASLGDGLDKIARGELAPETLTLQLQRQSENPRSQEGWILRLENGQAQISFASPEGWTEPRRVRLAREEAAGLARQLAAVRPEELPVNLYSSWYEDLEIGVLNRKTSLQARRFASLTPETHGEKQKRYEQLIAALEGMKQTLSP
jgi:hypothetical protein